MRRLREDVEWALALAETDPVAFQQGGALPSEAREIGAPQKDPARDTVAPAAADREIGAPQREAAETCSIRFIGPAEVVQLFRAVVCTVRRRMETMEGRLPTEGQTLDAMLEIQSDSSRTITALI